MQRRTQKYAAMLKMTIFSFLACGLILGGCGDDGTQQKRPDPEVAFYTVETTDLDLTTELPGRTSPFQLTEIRPQINGSIQQVAFTEGSDVMKGDLLFQIDPVLYQANYNAAKANLAKAQAYLPSITAQAKRYEELLKINAVSKQNYDDTVSALQQARADLDYAKAALQQAETNLNYTRITAPFSGRIGKTDARTGTLVSAYQAVSLATLQQLDPMYVDVTQSSSDFLNLWKHFQSGALTTNEEIARKVTLILEDGTVYPHYGELKFKDATVDPSTGSSIIRIKVVNPDLMLYPGMFVRAILQEGRSSEAIVIPQQAVRRNYRGEPYVFLVTPEDTIKEVPIVLDRTIGNEWLIASGLSKGDRLVMEGSLNIADGIKVRSVPFTKKEETGQNGNVSDEIQQNDQQGSSDKNEEKQGTPDTSANATGEK